MRRAVFFFRLSCLVPCALALALGPLALWPIGPWPLAFGLWPLAFGLFTFLPYLFISFSHFLIFSFSFPLFSCCFPLCPCFALSMFCYAFFHFFPFVLSFLHSRIPSRAQVRNFWHPISHSSHSSHFRIPRILKMPAPEQARTHFFSEQSLGQVPGGDNTDCRECQGMLSSVPSLERLHFSPWPLLCIQSSPCTWLWLGHSYSFSSLLPLLAPHFALALVVGLNQKKKIAKNGKVCK